MVQEKRILYEHLDVPNINTFEVYRQYDGYTQFEKALAEFQPEEIAQMVVSVPGSFISPANAIFVTNGFILSLTK